MEAIGKITFVVTSLVLLVVGLRLLFVWRRTREAAELSIGLAYAAGTIGLFILVSTAEAARAGQPVFWIWWTGHAAIQLAQASLIVGVWRIFVPEQRAVAIGGVCLALLSIGLPLASGRVELFTEISAPLLLSTATGLYAYGWVAVESLRFAEKLRRRRALGLSDTLAIWRFRAWGCAALAAMAVSGLSLLSVAVYQTGLSRVPWIFMIAQVLLVFSSANTWSAFFPPSFYRKMSKRRDAALAANA